jgi:transposase
MRRELVMSKITRFVGLDVHAQTIAIAVAESGRDGEVRSVGTIPNRPEAVNKAMKKLGRAETLAVCYEAGPTGYGLYWQLTELGIRCEVVAPTLVPVRAGDRVKTDRRDAEKLARCYRSGDLTPVWVPDKEHEALRDLVRCRLCAVEDLRRARQHLRHFLLRHGLRPPTEMKAWTKKYRLWLKTVKMQQLAAEATLLDYKSEVQHAEERVERLERAIDTAVAAAPATMRAVIEALQSLRGVAKVSAVTLVAELGKISRFDRASQLMGYAGVVPGEHSTGDSVRRGAITKAGNGHVRRVIMESARAYQHRPGVYGALKKRQVGQSEEIKAIAWKAQNRLCGRYRKLAGKGKPHQKVVTAVGRELLGFVWAIGKHVENATA